MHGNDPSSKGLDMAAETTDKPFAIVGKGTVVILILVSLMPPNRSDRWLGGLGASRGS